MLFFEWDPTKAAQNARKHRVTFDEAETCFGDPRSIDILDPDHSLSEDRFIKIGLSSMGRLLVVVYTERGIFIRLISARRANAREKKRYDSQEN